MAEDRKDTPAQNRYKALIEKVFFDRYKPGVEGIVFERGDMVAAARQDLACCARKFPNLICRPVSAQFMEGNQIALFELASEGGETKIVDEKHYRLVPAGEIDPEELSAYSRRAS